MTKTALLAALPSADVRRFTASRKAAIVAAVNGGAISEKAALARYEISEAEFAAWCRDINKAGVAGLRVTRLQLYRALPA